MIKCIVIDDEPLALKQLVSYVEKNPDMALVGSFASPVEARKLFEQGEKIDAMFIDINMPDINGLDFVRSLTEPPAVVFTTAYAEYAVKGFELEAVDYLLKPFGYDEFMRAAKRLKKRQELLMNNASVLPDNSDKAIFVKTDYKVVRIAIDSIRYVEAMSEYLRIHFVDRTQPVVVLMSMKRMREHLPQDMFMRIQRSYIINLSRIREITRNHVVLDNGVSLPIGDLYKDAFLNYLNAKVVTK